MGHDILGFSKNENNKKLAYIRRQTANDTIIHLYRSLKFECYYRPESGTAKVSLIDDKRIKKALNYFRCLPNSSGFEEETNFLLDCLSLLDHDKKCYIFFG
jgi:hypothetical protein